MTTEASATKEPHVIYAPRVPEFAVTLTDPDGIRPDESLLVNLNKVPKQGSGCDLGNGVPAQVKKLRMMSGEVVIFAMRDKHPGRRRLKTK